jgi:hypothetical protein
MSALQDDASIRPFQFHASEEALADLRRRIAATKWPSPELVGDASQGVQLATVRDLRACGRRTTTGAASRPGSTPCPNS